MRLSEARGTCASPRAPALESRLRPCARDRHRNQFRFRDLFRAQVCVYTLMCVIRARDSFAIGYIADACITYGAAVRFYEAHSAAELLRHAEMKLRLWSRRVAICAGAIILAISSDAKFGVYERYENVILW